MYDIYDWKEIKDMEYRIHLARLNAPKDVITKIAIWANLASQFITIILLPIELVTTALGGCLITLTFGILLIILSIIWWPFFIFILGTSWLWLHAWYLRPLLLIPGVLISFIADIYITLAPDPEKPSKHAKLSIIATWPLSWYLLKPPATDYAAKIVKGNDIAPLEPISHVEFESSNQVSPALIGAIEPGLIWYDGLDKWENLVTGRKIPVGKHIYISPIWRNLSSIPMMGHINLMITFPDTKNFELLAAQNQDQQALLNNAMTVRFQPFASTLKGNYMLTTTLRPEGKTLDSVTFTLHAISD